MKTRQKRKLITIKINSFDEVFTVLRENFFSDEEFLEYKNGPRAHKILREIDRVLRSAIKYEVLPRNFSDSSQKLCKSEAGNEFLHELRTYILNE